MIAITTTARWNALLLAALLGQPAPGDPPEPGAIVEELRGIVGHDFHVYRAPHFVIIYDTAEPYARLRGSLLEKTYELFYAAFEKAGLAPGRPVGPLVCVLFRGFEDYCRYARATDGEGMGWAGGYYSLRTGRIAFYHDRTSPRFGQVARQVDDLDGQIDEAEEELDAARRGRDTSRVSEARLRLSDLRQRRRWLTNRLDAVAAGNNDAKTTHEAVHQLAFGSGLQNPLVVYPLWVSEGLAANFEAADPSRGFGPYDDNPARRKLLVEAHARGRLAPLAEFAAMTDLPADCPRERALELYAQSWGFFRFLFQKRNAELRGYLRALASAAPGPRSGQAMRAELEAAFGPIPKLERDFSAYLRAVRQAR